MGCSRTTHVIESLGEAACVNILNNGFGKHRAHERPGMRAVIADITNAVMPGMVYEASIEDYPDRKLIMYEKPEPRDGMLKTNSKSVIKSLGEAVFENILDKVLDKHRVHEEPGMRAVMDYIIDATILNIDQKPGPRDGTLKTSPKYKNVNVDIIDAVRFNKEYEADIQVHREINVFKELEMRMLKTTLKCKYDKNANKDEKSEMADIINAVMLNTEYEDGIQVHQGGEINMFEEAEMRMLKTNPKYKNVYVDIIAAAMFNKKHEAGIQVHQGGEINMFKVASVLQHHA